MLAVTRALPDLSFSPVRPRKQFDVGIKASYQPRAARGQLEIDDARAGCGESRGGALKSCMARRVRVVPARRAAYADARSRSAALSAALSSQVGRGVSRQDVQAQRRVFGAAREYADGVERFRNKFEPGTIDGIEAGFIADHAAIRGGAYRRAASLRAERERYHVVCDRCG